jgi:signal transduction histidine kinase
MEAKATNGSQNTQTTGQAVKDIALLSPEEKTALLEETLAELEQKKRELEIEAALERVRTVAMSMKGPADMLEVCKTISQQLETLTIKKIRNVQTAIFYEERGTYMNYEYYAKHDKTFITETTYTNNEIHNAFANQMLKGSGEFFHTHIKDVKNWIAYQKTTNVFIDEYLATAPSLDYYWYSLGPVALGISTYEPLAEEDIKLFKRFLKVFELAYRRYLDIEKAEAQAREAQIEAALERVRARTMAIQKSEELTDVAELLFRQVNDLGIKTWSTGFEIWSEDNNFFTDYITNPQGGFIEPYTIDSSTYSVFKKVSKAKKRGDEYYVHYEEGEKLAETYRQLRKYAEKQFKAILDSGFQFPSKQYEHFVFGSIAGLMFITCDPVPEADQEVFKRFGKVFEQTYTRFLDLKKAEAQAREARIEAALERVRARAMAMQKSDELKELIATVSVELGKLDIVLFRSFIITYDAKTMGSTWWMANPETPSEPIGLFVKYHEHPCYLARIEAWKKRRVKWVQILEGEVKKTWDKFLFVETELSQLPHDVIENMRDIEKVYLSSSFNNFSDLTLATLSPLTDEQFDIMLRFAKVFDLSYTRFNDLQVAEANAKEAVKQAALDRIRAEIASMRMVKDLDRIIPLIWNELTTLGLPFVRCGVFIMDDAQQLIHTFLSTPQGKAIAAFQIPYNTSGNIADIIRHWQKEEIYTDHWDEQAFTEFAHNLVQQGALAAPEEYLSTLPPSGFYLHFLPFQQGMLYVGNTSLLGKEEISLLQSVADAFSTAYARYEDFNRLEAAKQKVDKTLVELKQAQQQLIQAEKMASLGELTAGIAHEIQNPLNFVNNFADVNKELVAELKQEAEKGNLEEVKALATDIEENEQKISHHGRRADAIVKGMLQHSRVSTGQKEPTDINALCDEYLRLSYHGFRAKDKTLSAVVQTAFDPAIGKVAVVPQEIGRVLLNLFNNAFYAVNEKKKHLNGTFEPAVSVSTKKEGDHVIIVVKDNGTGMPQSVMNKVFQPFFTTKPTGEGTGLGLSLSYDIISKGHGGDLTVYSKEGEGSEFVVTLPA